MSTRDDDDLSSAREALDTATRHAQSAEDGEAKARGLCMVADGYRRLWETQKMWADAPSERRQFTGEPDADLELWLGDAFESWLPGREELLLRIDGREVTVLDGQWLVKTANGITVED